MWSLEVSIYSVMLSAYHDSFAVSLLTWMPLVSFSFLIAVSRTSSTAFNRSGESGPPCLVSDFSRKPCSFSLSSIIWMWAWHK